MNRAVRRGRRLRPSLLANLPCNPVEPRVARTVVERRALTVTVLSDVILTLVALESRIVRLPSFVLLKTGFPIDVVTLHRGVHHRMLGQSNPPRSEVGKLGLQDQQDLFDDMLG